jgi:hypothetical protein
MEGLHIYCEADFLKRFFEEPPQSNSLLEEPEETLQWRNYKDLFFKDVSSICFDIDLEKFCETVKNNEIFKFLDKRNGGANIELFFSQFDKFTKNEEDFFKEVNPHTIFFLTDPHKCEQLEEDYGMMFISHETKATKAKFLFSEESEEMRGIKNIEKGAFDTWDFISKWKHPCNTVTIVDNYLFAGRYQQIQNRLQDNLLPLLSKLLPEKLNKKDFNLTIIVNSEKANREISEAENREIINTHKRLIREKLKRYTYNIKLNIITECFDNHDRNLLTNYLWISSGYGFSIFENRKCIANTQFTIRPILKLDVCEAVKFLEEQYKRIKNKKKDIK